MATVHEQLSEQFRRWERRGRGWQVYAEPVHLEPPFIPFNGHYLPQAPVIDDGKRPTFLSSLWSKATAPLPPVLEGGSSPEPEEPEPPVLLRDPLEEFQVSLPPDMDIASGSFEPFFNALALCREPLAFELLGVYRRVAIQFAAAPGDALSMRRQLQAFFPEAHFTHGKDAMAKHWLACPGEETLVIEFGLGREFMYPLASSKFDPFIGIVGALAELQPDELGLFQVLWQPAQEQWLESIVRSVTHEDGKPFFVNMPELAQAAEAKVSRPLFAAVVRLAIKAGTFDRALQIGCDVAGALQIFADPQGNHLIPLKNESYPHADHVIDLLFRQSRRSGMILNSVELAGFVHLPSSAVRSPSLARQTGKTKAAPAIVRDSNGLLLGHNEHAGEVSEVRLSPEQRVRHCHVIGATGTGKSTLLFNLIRQDIENGEGLAVLDPHGDLIDRILGIVPPERVDDVVLVDPSDPEYAVGFNILSAHSDLEKNLLASDLVAVFQRLSTSWGDQMNSVLQNAILAFLESDRGGTIADLRRFLIEPAFRNDFLKSVKDSEVVYCWQKSFPLLSGGKSIGPILTRLESFLGQKPIRHMVSQPENRLDFADIMDNGKIFLAKLPEGLLGQENSYLLGTLLVSKFHQIAMSRQAQQVESRRLFSIFIDEFANFIAKSMAETLTNARKYRISLTLAHHELQQLERNKDVASAVMSNPFARIVFQVGDGDAKRLAEGFSYFEPQDLSNLEAGHAICRVERSDYDFNLKVPLPDESDSAIAAARRREVITASRKKYGTLKTDVEAMLAVARTGQGDQPAPTPQPLPAAPAPSTDPKPEATKETVSEKKIVEPPRDLGRGGAQHQAVQQRIKKAAEELGFRSVIEKVVLDKLGSVDLLLERGDQTIACEISFSTTIDHEVGNVSKCLKAGFPMVVVICLDGERLKKIEEAVSGSLGPESAGRVRYFQPNPFIEYLKQLKAPASEAQVRGYKVRRSTPDRSSQERRQKEDIANRVIAEAMRRK
jgi:hypothetical protein